MERGYPLENCVQEYIEYKVNAELGRSALISKEKVQAEHEEVKRQISLLKLRKLRRELHEAADVEFYLSDMLVRFKNRLLALPSKLAMEIAGWRISTISYRSYRKICWILWKNFRNMIRMRSTREMYIYPKKMRKERKRRSKHA